MIAAITFSILLGLLWNIIVVHLMGGRIVEALDLSWMLAGAIAGATAGWFTVWSRTKQDGEETLRHGLATYYLAIVAYWASFVITERVRMCVRQGRWTDFGLYDHSMLIVWFVVYGTLLYGIILIPLAFLSRYLIWKTYVRVVAS